MIRRLLPLALILTIVVPASARTRGAVSAADARLAPIPGTIVSGIVSAVSGNTISLAAGLVTIDASAAKVTTDRGEAATVDVIRAGMMVVATIQSGDIAPNAPLPAVAIAVTRLADVVLSGPVQSVDVAGNAFILLGRTIRVTSETSFGGMGRDNTTRGLADILPNQLVHVQANVAGGALVAVFVQVFAPMPPPSLTFRGAVKSISTDQWVIGGERGDVTVVVNAQTKIVGSPRVGDLVEVVASVDSSNAYIALAILKVEIPQKPVSIRGTVKSMSADAWVITDRSGNDMSILVNTQTKIYPDIKIGDTVEILANSSGDGTLTALVIMRVPLDLPPLPPPVRFLGTVKAISLVAWTVTVDGGSREVRLLVTPETKIVGNPQVNDRVEVVAIVERDTYKAITIVKQ